MFTTLLLLKTIIWLHRFLLVLLWEFFSSLFSSMVNYVIDSVGMMWIKIVESVGEGVTHVKPGDHALLVFNWECGDCPHCKSEEINMCDLLRINTDRGVMINDNKSRFTIKGEPVHHFVGTSTFSEYTLVHVGCVPKINPTAPLDKVCTLSCGISTGLGAVWFWVAIGSLYWASLVDMYAKYMVIENALEALHGDIS